MYKQLLALFLWFPLLFACNDSSEQTPNIKPIPPGTGIDTTIDRTKIDRIIHQLYHPDGRYVMIASHRGDWQTAPENTLQAIQSCIDLGVEIVEIDVRKTFNDHLVVIHDSSLDRTTTGTGKISERTLAYIQSLYTKDKFGEVTPHRVPTLAEVMQFAKGKVLIMIDKGNDYFPEIRDVLIETKTMDHALFIEPYPYAEAKQKLGTYMFENAHFVGRIKQSDTEIDKYLHALLKFSDAPAFEFKLLDEDAWTLRYVDELKKQNRRIWISTITPEMSGGRGDHLAQTDPDAAWGWCIAQGADILLTDYPQQMVNYLTRKGHR